MQPDTPVLEGVKIVGFVKLPPGTVPGNYHPEPKKKRAYGPTDTPYRIARQAFLAKKKAKGECHCAVKALMPRLICDGNWTIHHRKGRLGKYLTDTTHFVIVCKKHHAWIHENEADAADLGLYVPYKTTIRNHSKDISNDAK